MGKNVLSVPSGAEKGPLIAWSGSLPVTITQKGGFLLYQGPLMMKRPEAETSEFKSGVILVF